MYGLSRTEPDGISATLVIPASRRTKYVFSYFWAPVHYFQVISEPPLEKICRDWEKIWVLDKKPIFSGTRVFIENRKKVPSGDFREESIAVVYFKIVWLVITGKSEQNGLQNAVIRR